MAMVRSSELLAKLELEDLDLILRERERPKLTRKKLMENGCREWKLTTVDPQ